MVSFILGHAVRSRKRETKNRERNTGKRHGQRQRRDFTDREWPIVFPFLFTSTPPSDKHSSAFFLLQRLLVKPANNMAPSKLRKAIGAVKDQTSIGLAKVGNSSCISDLDVAIVKATRHEEFPADERYIREILSLTCYSRAHISACVNTLSRRLSKTKNWTVALKTLMLIHRLLAEGDPAYEEEIFFSTRRGTRLLNMSDFRDTSRSDAWDHSAFIRTFALYLDERLEYKMQGRRGKRSMFGLDEDAEDASQPSHKATPVREMKTEHMFSKMQHLQQILDRFLACRPTGWCSV